MQPPAEKNPKFFGADKFALYLRIAIGILGVLFLAVAVSRLAFPFDNGILEAFNWMPAEHLLEGKNPYGFALTPPYSMSPYGVVFYALVAVGVKFFGFQLWFSRLLTVFGFIVSLWATTRITRKITGNKESALITLLAGLAMFPAQFWIGAVRPDLIGIGFVSVILWLAFTQVEENKKTPFTIIAGIILLSAAAFFTKQTFFFTAAVAAARFLQLRKWREAVLTALGFTVVITTGIFLLNHTSDGGYLWQHWTHAKHLPFGWDETVRSLLQILKTPVYSLSLIFLLLIVYLERKFLAESECERWLEFLRSPKLLIFAYFLASFGWAFVSGGRVGSNVNYYIESSFLLAILLGLICDDFKRNFLLKPAVAMVVLLAAGGAFQLVRTLRGESLRWQALGYYREIFARTAEFTQRQPEERLCISVAPEMVVWNGCGFHFDDFSEYENGWSPELRETFEREVKTNRYAAILWYDDTLQSKFPNYSLVPMKEHSPPERFFPIYLYVPAGKIGTAEKEKP